jgi:hypothetical protein
METIDVKILKGIPEEQITDFEDKTIYYAAVLTREYTKNMQAYPHLTGELEQQEIKAPIKKSGNGAYALLDGTDYAKYVYKMTDVNWTNPRTQPQWYSTIFRRKEKTIVDKAQERALGELK